MQGSISEAEFVLASWELRCLVQYLSFLLKLVPIYIALFFHAGTYVVKRNMKFF